MRWTDKGDDYYKYYRILLENLHQNKKIWIFGAGEIGGDLVDFYEMFSDLSVEGFIDNSIEKQGSQYKGRKIISLNEWLSNKSGAIALGIGGKFRTEVISQLNAAGLEEYRDFAEGNKLLQAYLYREKGKLFIHLSQICVTERCTLRCKKCAHGCQHVPGSRGDMEIGEAKKSADTFFRYVDYCGEFVIIGGETLLYKDLREIIDYIGEHYRSRINIFSVTTNGTILPSKELALSSKKYDVLWRVSDYSKSIPRLKSKYETLKDFLISNSMSYFWGFSEGEWMDYGFGDIDRGSDETILINAFDNCLMRCHESRGTRFHYCVMARSVAENMKYDVGKTDYLELSDLETGEGKKQILEYSLGFSNKGYLDMCRFCRGGEAFRYPIPVAEQV